MPFQSAALPVTLTGAGVALFIAGGAGFPPAVGQAVEMPMTKTTIKRAAKKTEVTGSTSTSNADGATQTWQEFSPGPSGGTLEAEGHWRIGQAIMPTQLRQGAIYYAWAYVWRPGWFSGGDPGGAYQGYILIDDNTTTLDPNSGSVDWRLMATFTGPIVPPSAPPAIGAGGLFSGF